MWNGTSFFLSFLEKNVQVLYHETHVSCTMALTLPAVRCVWEVAWNLTRVLWQPSRMMSLSTLFSFFCFFLRDLWMFSAWNLFFVLFSGWSRTSSGAEIMLWVYSGVSESIKLLFRIITVKVLSRGHFAWHERENTKDTRKKYENRSITKVSAKNREEMKWSRKTSKIRLKSFANNENDKI